MSKLVKWSLPAVTFAIVVALAGARAGAQEGAADKAKTAKVSGVVQDEEGKPVANVTVRLVVPPSREKKEGDKKEQAKPQAADGGAAASAVPLQAEDAPAKKKPERPKPVAEGKTDAEGKFTIEAPPGKYTVIANLRGQGRAQKTVELKAGETTDVGPLVLKRPAPKKEAAPST